MTEHKHAWVLREIADGASPEDYEFRLGPTHVWYALRDYQLAMMEGDGEIRRKAKMIRIGDVEFSEPVREPLAYGTEYFFVNLARPQLVSKGKWTDHPSDCLWGDRGLVHLTEDAAVRHAEALIKLSGGTV